MQTIMTLKLRLKPLLILQRWCHTQTKPATSAWIKPTGFNTEIVVYNSIAKTRVPLILKNNKIATWYICGPTVYDSAHIGHACSYMRLDIIRRILTEFFDINVISVMGITDIDDKIIRRSQGSSKFSDFKQLAKFYEHEFYTQMQSLQILPPYMYCRVSDYIPQIINFISNIVAKKMAYIATDGSVYFDTMAYGKYGKLNQSEPENHPIKKTSLDFALWKASKESEPFWESPWGIGRPGWHIECSTMASFTLGDSIDIHSGGLDLMFPHHENEEAQSCCHHGTDQWVNYWIHSGLLHLQDVKMSKSLQNTITIKELLDKYTAKQFRFLCLLTHYRTPIDFCDDSMQKAITILKKFEYFQSDCQNYMSGNFHARHIDESLIYSKLSEAKKNIHEALANDFSTPKAIAELANLVAIVNKILDPSQPNQNYSGPRNAACINAVSTYLTKTLASLGITKSVETTTDSKVLGEIIDTFTDFRTLVRNKALNTQPKDVPMLQTCDNVRNKLAACGIQIKDYKDAPSTWTSTKD